MPGHPVPGWAGAPARAVLGPCGGVSPRATVTASSGPLITGHGAVPVLERLMWATSRTA